MKKVYIEVKNKLPVNVDIQNAIDGFEYLGYEPRFYIREDILSGSVHNLAHDNMFVGSIDTMTALFKKIDKYPKPIDFPIEVDVAGLLNRKIIKMELNAFINLFKATHVPKFVKPVETKLFDGALISKEEHLNYLRGFNNPDVYISDKLDIVSEHRAYIHKGKLIYCCCYDGDFKIAPDYYYIEDIIKAYKSAPISYTIDVAILENGMSTIIEVNDFWSIGSYGLKSWDYAQMLLDRYNEIINTNFIE